MSPFVFYLCVTILINEVMLLVLLVVLPFISILRSLGWLRNDPMGRGADNARISRLPTRRFRAGMFPPDESKCIICLADYAENDELRILPCATQHHFHKACIDEWLRLNATCPNCREEIPEADRNAVALEQQQQHPEAERGARAGSGDEQVDLEAPPTHGGFQRVADE